MDLLPTKRLYALTFSFLFFLFFTSFSTCADEDSIRVTFNSNGMPYHYINDEGEYVGMHIDMLNYIAKEKNIKIVYIPYRTNSECISALKNREVDVLLGHKTNDRAVTGFQHTNELSSSSLCLIVPSKLYDTLENSENYRQYSAAIEFGTAANYNMLKMGIQRYLAKANQQEVFEAVIEGQADMAIVVHDCFMFLSNEYELKDKYKVLRRYISPVSYSMFVRQSDLLLFNMLESGLTELRSSGNYEKIYKKWQVEDEETVTREMIRKTVLAIRTVMLFTLVIILFSVMINRVLKNKVAEKTKELQNVNIELDKRMIQIQSDSRIHYGMIEFSPSGMVSFDTNYCITLINHAALHISGIKDTCLGEDVRNLNIFGDILSSIKYDIFSLENYDEKISRPVTIELGETDKKSYRYIIYNSRDESGIYSILLNVEDVTVEERKKQELFDKEKNRSLNLLIAGIAHEIKNPLMAIRTASSLIKTQGNDPEVREAFVKFVPNEVDRINQLVEGLINYARPVKGKKEYVNLAAVVKDCLYLTKFAIKHKNIDCKIELDKSVYMLINKDKIKQSLINIIMNSIESMDKKHKHKPDLLLLMRVKVSKDYHFAYVYIYDEGTGMNEDEVKQCMKPFYTTKAAGTGLGLSLVRQLMEENDGLIEVKSNEGRNTEILLKFRRCDKSESENTYN